MPQICRGTSFFSSPRAVGMDLDDGAVSDTASELDADQLGALQVEVRRRGLLDQRFMPSIVCQFPKRLGPTQKIGPARRRTGSVEHPSIMWSSTIDDMGHLIAPAIASDDLVLVAPAEAFEQGRPSAIVSMPLVASKPSGGRRDDLSEPVRRTRTGTRSDRGPRLDGCCSSRIPPSEVRGIVTGSGRSRRDLPRLRKVPRRGRSDCLRRP